MLKFISISWKHLFYVPNYITEREKATPAGKGDSMGILVKRPVKVGTNVYKIYRV